MFSDVERVPEVEFTPGQGRNWRYRGQIHGFDCVQTEVKVHTDTLQYTFLCHFDVEVVSWGQYLFLFVRVVNFRIVPVSHLSRA